MKPVARTNLRFTAAALTAAILIALFASGCVVVPQNRRARIADPMMSLGGSSLDSYRKQKFFSTREGAAGGEGRAAGGGCGCQ